MKIKKYLYLSLIVFLLIEQPSYSLTEIETGVISKNNYTQVQDRNTGSNYDLSNITDNMKIEMSNFQIRRKF